MKKYFSLLLIMQSVFISVATAQVTSLAGDYKIINIGTNGYGDYTQSLILLHQIYNGTPIDHNYTIGMVTAMRGAAGAGNRTNVVNVNTSSAYVSTAGTINSYDDNSQWTLKTCLYNGSLYLALDIPYSPAYHNWGYQFSGWTNSTGESMKCVSYLVNGQPVNQSILTNIQNFTPNMVETHETAGFNITGNVGIGTPVTQNRLEVNGNIHSKQVTVDLNGWSDFVFQKDYDLPSLEKLKTYVSENHHLPGIPSEQEVLKDGINLGEMNKLLLKKIEELTLYLVAEKEQERKQQVQLNQFRKQLRLINETLNKK